MTYRGAERRRHKRFDMASTGSKLARIERASTRLTLQNCELVNLSFGGMSIRSTEELEPEGLYDFLIDLQEPLKVLLFVRANIRWVHSSGSRGWMIGAAVVESSKAWLGAFDDQIH